MYNNDKKDDFQNFHDQWCEDWHEDWNEIWYDENSLNIKQTTQKRYKKAQPSADDSLVKSDLDDVHEHHNIDEVSEYKTETDTNKDHQVKSRSNFLDFVDELESALDPQNPVSECDKVHYDCPNASIDSVISMD